MFNNLISLSDYSIVKISGDAASTFLQGQLTCDMQEITHNTFRLGAYCNPQGRIWSIMRIWKQGNDYFFHLPSATLSSAVNDLGKYALFSKVKIEAQTDYASMAIVADNIESSINGMTLPLIPMSSVATDNLTILCIEKGRWLLIATKNTLQALANEIEATYSSEDSANWDLLEIKAGIPTISATTIEKFLPHEVNLPELGAVSFTKGCYKGQEIIARMQYRAQRKKHMYLAQCITNADVLPGTLITDANQKNVGEVVSAIAVVNKYELLAVLQDAMVEEQIPLLIAGHPLTDIKLPVYS